MIIEIYDDEDGCYLTTFERGELKLEGHGRTISESLYDLASSCEIFDEDMHDKVS